MLMASRRKKTQHDKTGMYLTVMVACVAIIALVVLVLNFTEKETVVVTESTEGGNGEDAALAGEAFRVTAPVVATGLTESDFNAFVGYTYEFIHSKAAAKKRVPYNQALSNPDFASADFFVVSVDSPYYVIGFAKKATDGSVRLYTADGELVDLEVILSGVNN